MSKHVTGDDDGSESDLIIQNDTFSPVVRIQPKINADMSAGRHPAAAV
jgi:hypothetical protein